jgi:putative FmdB family regulatory protein
MALRCVSANFAGGTLTQTGAPCAFYRPQDLAYLHAGCPGVRRGTVPTYQYCCAKCEKTFERTETISEREVAKLQCPKCGSKKVSAVPGRVYVVTSKKSQERIACGRRSATYRTTPEGPLHLAVLIEHRHKPDVCLAVESGMYRTALS